MRLTVSLWGRGRRSGPRVEGTPAPRIFCDGLTLLATKGVADVASKVLFS